MNIKLFISFLLYSGLAFSQVGKVDITMYEGIVMAGYIDKGAFVNFTGPNINGRYRNAKIILGMLPSLRFQHDRGSPKNAFVTPNLGIGVSYIYKMVAIQLPIYYNAKTETENGIWHMGLGLGVRLDQFNTHQ